MLGGRDCRIVRSYARELCAEAARPSIYTLVLVGVVSPRTELAARDLWGKGNSRRVCYRKGRRGQQHERGRARQSGAGRDHRSTARSFTPEAAMRCRLRAFPRVACFGRRWPQSRRALPVDGPLLSLRRALGDHHRHRDLAGLSARSALGARRARLARTSHRDPRRRDARDDPGVPCCSPRSAARGMPSCHGSARRRGPACRCRLGRRSCPLSGSRSTLGGAPISAIRGTSATFSVTSISIP